MKTTFLFKSISIFLMVCSLMFVFNKWIIDLLSITPQVSIVKSYAVSGILTVLVVICLLWINSLKFIKIEIGIVYLIATFLKVGLLILCFNNLFFKPIKLHIADKIILIIPYLTGLFFEALLLVKYISKKKNIKILKK